MDSLLLGPSQFSLGLQAAELAVASTLVGRWALGEASRWHKRLLPRFARHPATGKVDGVGLKEFPPKAKGEVALPEKLFDIRPGSRSA